MDDLLICGSEIYTPEYTLTLSDFLPHEAVGLKVTLSGSKHVLMRCYLHLILYCLRWNDFNLDGIVDHTRVQQSPCRLWNELG